MSSLFGTEGIAHLGFWVLVGITMGGAGIAVFPRNILHNVLGLIVALTGVAGIYLFLGSLFVAMMQLLIYVGAICIAIVFAIMLSRPLHLAQPGRNLHKVAGAAGAALLFLAGVVGVVSRTHWQPVSERGTDWSIRTIGDLLLTRYDLSFELISLVLLVAIIGAIVTAGFSRRLNS